MLREKKMIRKRIAETVLLGVVTGVVVPAQLRALVPNNDVNANDKHETPAKADLLVREFVFPTGDKSIRVRVVNAGGTASALCVLRLTVRKINGIPAGRVTEVKLPPLAAGKDIWLVINAKSILPINVSLESTTFKLNADATSIVTESNEGNNEVWHKL